MVTKKATWLQAGFHVLGVWFFLEGALSLGRRLTPGVFPEKLLSYGFPGNLLFLLLGACLFLGARRLASQALFSSGREEPVREGWNEHPFLESLFFLAGVYLLFKIVPMLPNALSGLLRKLGYYEGPNTSGLLIFLSTGVLLVLSWYFLSGAPWVRRAAAGEEGTFRSGGGGPSLSRRDILESAGRVMGVYFLVSGVVTMAQEAWDWNRPYDSLAPFLGGVVWLILGFLLAAEAHRVVPLLLKEDGPASAGDSSLPGFRDFLEAGFLAMGAWFLLGAVLELIPPLAARFLQGGTSGRDLGAAIYGSFWEAYGRNLARAVLSLLLLFQARRLAGWCAGRGAEGGEPSPGSLPLPREAEKTGFLAGGILLGIFILADTFFSLVFFLTGDSSGWLLRVLSLAVALLVLWGTPFLAGVLYPAGKERPGGARPSPPLLDPALRIMGLWFLSKGILNLPFSLYMTSGPLEGSYTWPLVLQGFLQVLAGALLLFGSHRFASFLSRGESSAAAALPGKEASP